MESAHLRRGKPFGMSKARSASAICLGRGAAEGAVARGFLWHEASKGCREAVSSGDKELEILFPSI